MRAFMTAFVFSLLAVFAGSAQAAKKEKPAPATEEVQADEAAPKPNACGCYRQSNGQCQCTKKSKCGCPDDCEPAGCEEKRQKEFEKESQAEIKKQRESQDKQDGELTRRREEQEAKEADDRGKKKRK